METRELMVMWDSAGIPENREHFLHWRMRLLEQAKGPEHEVVTSCRDASRWLRRQEIEPNERVQNQIEPVKQIIKGLNTLVAMFQRGPHEYGEGARLYRRRRT